MEDDDWAPLLDESEEPQAPTTEEFDPSWPYNFKWGVSRDGRTDVWRTQGGLDGRPVHRAELSRLWGYPPMFRDGDQLGMASFIPAERKLDGTVVAPPVVVVHAYYGLPTPQSVYDWFEQQFPGIPIREAQVTNDFKGRPMKLSFDWSLPEEEQNIIKWLWNQRDGLLVWETDAKGLPTHTEKAESTWGREASSQAGDIFGYAYPNGDEIDIEGARFDTPAAALSAVKAELAKLYPNAHIKSDQDLAEQYGVEFHGSPDKLGRRMAAAEWAQRTLEVTSHDPLEGAESASKATVADPDDSGRTLSGLRRLLATPSIFRRARRTTADADMDGAMVALFIPKETGKKLGVKGGEPLENLHITLLYFQDKSADRDDWDEVAKVVEQVANQTPALTGKISGFGVFNNDDVLWAVPTLQGLASLREKLFTACEDAGFPVSKTHDWAPHITLKYDHKGDLPKIDDEISLDIGELSFARGENREDFKLDGHFEKEAVWGPQEWDGWQGTHRFVTDGKEIVTDPDDGKGEDLFEKFRSLYPDSQHLVDGRVVPTADEMGYGVHAPTLGWTHPDGPQIHNVLALLDKHFEKPTHLIEDAAALSDTDRYRATPDWNDIA